MKRITLLFVASLFVGATSFAGERIANVSGNAWNWSVSAGRLTNYLELNSNQYD